MSRLALKGEDSSQYVGGNGRGRLLGQLHGVKPNGRELSGLLPSSGPVGPQNLIAMRSGIVALDFQNRLLRARTRVLRQEAVSGLIAIEESVSTPKLGRRKVLSCEGMREFLPGDDINRSETAQLATTAASIGSGLLLKRHMYLRHQPFPMGRDENAELIETNPTKTIGLVGHPTCLTTINDGQTKLSEMRIVELNANTDARASINTNANNVLGARNTYGKFNNRREDRKPEMPQGWAPCNTKMSASATGIFAVKTSRQDLE